MSAPGAPAAVVIGTGRSGTGYVTQILRASGVDARHEGWFNPLLWGADVDRAHHPGLAVDVSWLALPFIESGEWSGPVLHVTRHPVPSVRSIEWTEHVTHLTSPFSAFARRHEPVLRDLGHLEAAVEWWARWNRRCHRAAVEHGGCTVRVEDLLALPGLLALRHVLGCEVAVEAAEQVPADVHSRERSMAPEEMIWDLLAGRAEEFGYLP